MSQSNWWATNIEVDISQGDIVSLFSFAVLNEPVKYLKKMNTLSNGLTGWTEQSNPAPDKKNAIHYLAKGKDLPGIIVSHSCDIDKNSKYILVAPIGHIDFLKPEVIRTIEDQSNIRLFGIPNNPNFGDGYADLRCITAIKSTVVKGLTRSASMTGQAQNLLQARLVEFFTRKTPEI